MTAYRVIGIDPALVNTGLCVLESAKPGDYRVTVAETIRPRPSWPMLQRLRHIVSQVNVFLACHDIDLDAIVVEDPTGQRATRTKGNNPRSIAVTGMAVGTVLGPLLKYSHLHFIDVEQWMPRQKSGRLSHIMAKPLMVRALMGLIKMPAGADEHQIMAAGLARWFIEQERMKARLSA